MALYLLVECVGMPYFGAIRDCESPCFVTHEVERMPELMQQSLRAIRRRQLVPVARSIVCINLGSQPILRIRTNARGALNSPEVLSLQPS
jgi:hypothetical protein